jgi:DmsE family decaheme c-type cytochrome
VGRSPTAARLEHLVRSPWLGCALLVAACAASRELSEARLAAREANAACAACHADAADELEAGRNHAGLSRAVGCLDCHLAHQLGENGARGPSGINQSCEDCHAEVVAEFQLPYAHPFGVTVGCTSCHPPHGLPVRELRHKVREDACVGCHVELRGPFVTPHEGDKIQACLSCHEPHGSPNPRLLTHADTYSLCFSCHEVIDELHVQEPGSLFRQCLNCHTEIHGSNWSELLFR